MKPITNSCALQSTTLIHNTPSFNWTSCHFQTWKLPSNPHTQTHARTHTSACSSNPVCVISDTKGLWTPALIHPSLLLYESFSVSLYHLLVHCDANDSTPQHQPQIHTTCSVSRKSTKQGMTKSLCWTCAESVIQHDIPLVIVNTTDPI